MPVSFEQAVYGSFPFWDRGYAILAQSPGCRPDWIRDLKAFCRELGDRPAGAAAGGLVATRLGSGPEAPWAILGMGDQGADDRGRPGALAFHALLLTPRDYRRLDGDPFRLAGHLRRDWTAETDDLPTGRADRADANSSTSSDPRAPRIAAAIAAGHRVALEADGPIDDLARDVWRLLPRRARLRASVATWAFGNGPRFDLVALPKLAAGGMDASYIDPDQEPAPRPTGRRRRAAIAGGLTLAGAGLALATALAVRGRDDRPPVEIRPSVVVDPVVTPGERILIAEGLALLADRFGVPADDDNNQPASRARRIAETLRYRGPRLSPAERAELAASASADPEARRALAWDRHVGLFADDRPLPGDFDAASPGRQLAELLRSFHLDDDLAGSASEAPSRLADALAVDVATHPLPDPIVSRHPALDPIGRFLDRLPRR